MGRRGPRPPPTAPNHHGRGRRCSHCWAPRSLITTGTLTDTDARTSRSQHRCIRHPAANAPTMPIATAPPGSNHATAGASGGTIRVTALGDVPAWPSARANCSSRTFSVLTPRTPIQGPGDQEGEPDRLAPSDGPNQIDRVPQVDERRLEVALDTSLSTGRKYYCGRGAPAGGIGPLLVIDASSSGATGIPKPARLRQNEVDRQSEVLDTRRGVRRLLVGRSVHSRQPSRWLSHRLWQPRRRGRRPRKPSTLPPSTRPPEQVRPRR